MCIRVLSATLALPFFFILLYFLPAYCMPFGIGIVAAFAVSEILRVSNAAGKNRFIYIMCMIFGFIVPIFEYFFYGAGFYYILLPFTFLLFFTSMFDISEMSFDKIAICLFSSAVIPYFMSGVGRIALFENGVYVTIFPFVIAWCCDTSAYFFGKFFGRHKLCEMISPKKTVEGAVGGFVGAALCTAAYGFVLQSFFNISVNFSALCIFSVVGAFVAQIGDLSMSLIKRNYQVKDYGEFMPGHGGVLDRFDSVIFVIPLVEIFLALFPNVIKL